MTQILLYTGKGGVGNLLAARSLIDYWAERLAEKPESHEQSRDGARQSIPID